MIEDAGDNDDDEEGGEASLPATRTAAVLPPTTAEEVKALAAVAAMAMTARASFICFFLYYFQVGFLMIHTQVYFIVCCSSIDRLSEHARFRCVGPHDRSTLPVAWLGESF